MWFPSPYHCLRPVAREDRETGVNNMMSEGIIWAAETKVRLERVTRRWLTPLIWSVRHTLLHFFLHSRSGCRSYHHFFIPYHLRHPVLSTSFASVPPPPVTRRNEYMTEEANNGHVYLIISLDRPLFLLCVTPLASVNLVIMVDLTEGNANFTWISLVWIVYPSV